MEFIERASFIEIYWSLVCLAHFMTFTIPLLKKPKVDESIMTCQTTYVGYLLQLFCTSKSIFIKLYDNKNNSKKFVAMVRPWFTQCSTEATFPPTDTPTEYRPH